MVGELTTAKKLAIELAFGLLAATGIIFTSGFTASARNPVVVETNDGSLPHRHNTPPISTPITVTTSLTATTNTPSSAAPANPFAVIGQDVPTDKAPVIGQQTQLYDGALGTLPDSQGWLSYSSARPPNLPQTLQSGYVEVDTTGDIDTAAGYTGAGLLLNRASGYTIRFAAQVFTETHSLPASDTNGDGQGDRAGFSLTAISSDGVNGIELGFWTDRIWAQEGGSAPLLFTQAEGAAFDTTAGLIPYELTVQEDRYSLTSGGSFILSGTLRNYTNAGSPPYTTPNALYLGDNTDLAKARFGLSHVAVITATNPPNRTTLSSTDLVISDVGVFDIDAEGADALLTLSAAHGTVTVAESVTHGVSSSNITGNGTEQVTLTGPPGELNTTLAADITYRGLDGFFGQDALTVLLNDLAPFVEGGPLTDQLVLGITVQAAELGLTKTVTPPTALPGQPLTYTLTFYNSGNLAAANTTLTDIVPVTLTNVNYTSSGVSLTPGGGAPYVWSAGSLAPGSGGIITITGQVVNDPFIGNTTIVNQATIAGDTLEASTGNNTAQTTTPVNYLPPTATDDTDSTPEDTSVMVPVLNNDDDPANLPLSIVALSSPAHGSAATVGTAITYIPGLHYNGSDSFRYTISNGTFTDTADVSITVHAQNDAPSFTVPGPQAVAPVTDSPITGLALTDVDAGGQAVEVSLAVSHGVLTLGATAGLTIGPGDGVADPNITITGPLTALNAALAGLSYRSQLGYMGLDTLTLQANDLGHSGAGGPLTDNATVDITVTNATNLVINKSVAPLPLIPGLPLTYTLMVSNAGPNQALGVGIADLLPGALVSPQWFCANPSGGAVCGGSGTGNLSATVNLPPNSSVVYYVTGVLNPATIDPVVNSAHLLLPAGLDELDPANNASTITTTVTPKAALQIYKFGQRDNQARLITYTITATNLGPSHAHGAVVSDQIPPGIGNFIAWSCMPSGGASCTATGAGPLNDVLVQFPANSQVIYTLLATVLDEESAITNVAQLIPPAGVSVIGSGHTIIFVNPKISTVFLPVVIK